MTPDRIAAGLSLTLAAWLAADALAAREAARWAEGAADAARREASRAADVARRGCRVELSAMAQSMATIRAECQACGSCILPRHLEVRTR